MFLPESLLRQCKENLLERKVDIMNRVRDSRKNLVSGDDKRGGDEADQTMAILQEKEALTHHERLRSQLVEIESALSRIDSGTYGICEETDEHIEADRLLAIPWTRLSIEGAELREAVSKRYARM